MAKQETTNIKTIANQAASAVMAKLPEINVNAETVDLFFSNLTANNFLSQMSPREKKALNEIIDLLDPKKLGGEDRNFDQRDLNQIATALLKDPQIACQINAGIWNTAYSTAESYVPDGLFSGLIRRIAYRHAEKNVRSNYGTYYAQGEQVAKQRIEGEVKGSLDELGVNPKDRKEDNVSRNLSLAEIEQFKVNLEILNNYVEKAIVKSKVIQSVSVPENGINAEVLEELKEGKLPNNDSERKIPFVPSKSNLLYASDAQLIEFGIPKEQLSAYRKGNEFYYDRQTDSLIYRTKEPQLKKDGTEDIVWAQKSRNGSRDQYGYYQAPSWKSVSDLAKVETEKLDRYTQWQGRSNLTLEKIESLGKVFGQQAESFEGKYSLEGKRVYRVKDAQGKDYVAIGEKDKEGKKDEKGNDLYTWHKANPSEMLDIKKLDQYNDWQKTHKNELERVDCKTIAELGINTKYLTAYDFYFKKDAAGKNSELIFVSKTNSYQGIMAIDALVKQQYPNLPPHRNLNAEESSKVAKVRSEESDVESRVTRIDPTVEPYKSMCAGYDKQKMQFFLGTEGQIIAQYEHEGKLITAVNYGSKEVFSEGKALDRNSWVMAEDFKQDIEKLKKAEEETELKA